MKLKLAMNKINKFLVLLMDCQHVSTCLRNIFVSFFLFTFSKTKIFWTKGDFLSSEFTCEFKLIQISNNSIEQLITMIILWRQFERCWRQKDVEMTSCIYWITFVYRLKQFPPKKTQTTLKINFYTCLKDLFRNVLRPSVLVWYQGSYKSNG